MTAREAAAELGVRVSCVYALYQDGKLKPKPRRGKWALDFAPEAVAALKKQREDAPRLRAEKRAVLARGVAELLKVHSADSIHRCALALERGREFR